MKLNKLLSLILAICMLACLAFVFSCETENTSTDTATDTATDTDTSTPEPNGYKLTLSKETALTITILNHSDEPLANAVVKFITANGDSSMDMTNDQGEVTKTITIGDIYITVENSTTKNEYYLVAKELNEQGVIFNAYDELSTSRVHDNGTPDEVDITDDRIAYVTRSTGKYYATNLNAESWVFFLFIPTEDGIYEFTTDIGAEVGYFGAPLNAYQAPIEPKAENGALRLEIKKRNLGETASQTTPYLIGIRSSEKSECLFEIKRVGDPMYTPEELAEWQIITNKNNPQPLFLSYANWNVTLNDIDISSPVNAVLGSDGYYHLGSADGELIYVRIGSESKYLASFYDVCTMDSMRAQLYDENGNFIKKEIYSELVKQYYELADEKTGLYPLDELMANAIKNHGNYVGWWKQGSANYRFSETTIDKDSAWLFACCTVKIEKNAGVSADAPVKVETSLKDDIKTEKAQMDAGSELFFLITSPIDSTLTVKNPNGNLVVVYNGEEYTSENGTFTVSIVKATSLAFSIKNTNESESETLEFTVS